MVVVHIPNPSTALPSTAKDYSHAYYHILKSARRQSALGSAASGAVLILVATDVDAICAARALSRLLAADEIMYRIAPVDGFRTLQRILGEDVVGNDDLHTLVMLNLGSLLSLPSYFAPETLPLPPTTHIHLIDSHRPWNLDNLFATTELMDRIWVWDDGDIISKMQREREAYEALEFEVDSDDEDDEEEEEDEDAEDGSESESEHGSGSEDERSVAGPSSSPTRRKRKRTGRGSDSEEEEDSASDEEQEGESHRRRRRSRRKRISKSPKPKRVTSEQRNLYRAVLARYYRRGTGLGMSVSAMMFVLAEALGRAENEGLWLAILGLTYQYVSNALPYDLYEAHASSLASDVNALNPPPPSNGHVVTNQSSSHIAKPTSADDGRIRVINDELRFTLYRHWSLESAMYHTPYVAGKLGVWREKGMTKIRGLLAKMGFSLIHSRQHYNNMPLDLRNSVVTRLEAIAPEYGLTELVFKSFIRSYGYRSSPLSAMDSVEGLNALLIAATGVRIEVQDEALTFSGAAPTGNGIDNRGAYAGQGTPVSSELFGAKRIWNVGGVASVVGGGRGPSSAPSDGKENWPAGAGEPQRGQDGDKEGEDPESSNPSRANEAWVRNFFVAYECLDTRKSSSLSLLNSSLSLARSLHSAILTVGTSLIEKQAIRSLRSFRLATLRDGPHLDLFSTQPAMLARLGMWLTDALRDIVNDQEKRKRVARREKERAKKQRKVLKKGGGGGGGGSGEADTTGDADADADAGDDDDAEADKTHSLPFVLCALHHPSSTYLVAGLVASSNYNEGGLVRNRFGLAFQDAIRKSGARSRNDGGLSGLGAGGGIAGGSGGGGGGAGGAAVVEVRKEDLGAFVERLHLRT